MTDEPAGLFGITRKPSPSATASAENAVSPMAALRRRREQLAAERVKDFDLPGYGGDLIIRYRRLGEAASNRALLQTPGEDWQRNAQFLLEACDGIYCRDASGDLVPAWDGERPAVVATDVPQWAELNDIFELGLADGQQIVLAVFGGNEHVLGDHADDVYRWMRSIGEPEHLGLLGG